MSKKLLDRLLKDADWQDFLWLTVAAALFMSPFYLKPFGWWIDIYGYIAQGLAVILFTFWLKNSVEIRFSKLFEEKRPKYDFSIKNTDDVLDKIKIEHKIAHDYLSKAIVEAIGHGHAIREQKSITVNSRTLYDHIIHSSQSFEESIISVDMDLRAWTCACSPEDYEALAAYHGNAELIERIKQEFVSQYKAYRRTNLTYMISKNIADQIESHQNSIKNCGAVKRLIVIDKEISQLTEKDLVILHFFERVTKRFKKVVYNKCIIKSELLDESTEKLEKLQDIILFDSKIAYQEHLNDNKESEKSQIITDKQQITSYGNDFSYLFNKGYELSDLLNNIKSLQTV